MVDWVGLRDRQGRVEGRTEVVTGSVCGMS